MTKDDVVKKFNRMLLAASPLLSDIHDRSAMRKIDPDRWSPKELLGHLIDSTANNHRRIVLALLQDDMLFDGYDQEGWVTKQYYQQCDWIELRHLWLNYNRLLLHTVKRNSEEDLLAPREKHTLNTILMKKHPADEPGNVLILVNDYIDHAVHHLIQIAQLTKKEWRM